MKMNSIETKQFYGKTFDLYNRVNDLKLKKQCKSELKKNSPKMPERLLGPTQFWAEFLKQADAINTVKECNKENDPLALFVYQDKDGFRHFVVAHPEVYWWYYNIKPPENRCSYEVILENEPCWLYFDLEFMKEKNPTSDGPKMIATLIEVVRVYILKYWGYPYNKKNVLNLDSTTDVKFSRHLIFCMKDIAFLNNFHVGKLVKKICSDLEKYVLHDMYNDLLKLFKKEDLKELLIETGKGTRVFVDTAVYSKNRHFRIYKSTKWGKQSYLNIAPDSEYIPSQEHKNQELQIFLDSLISYFPQKKNLLLLEFNEDNKPEVVHYSEELTLTQKVKGYNFEASVETQFPVLDKYIAELLKPGKIRICKFYQSLNLIIYEVYGNRYCRNIGRSHKSNNIYWVVDLTKKVIFQKCHDEDCAGFVSEPQPLPENVKFYFNEESDALLLSLPDQELSMNCENDESPT